MKEGKFKGEGGPWLRYSNSFQAWVWLIPYYSYLNSILGFHSGSCRLCRVNENDEGAVCIHTRAHRYTHTLSHAHEQKETTDATVNSF